MTAKLGRMLIVDDETYIQDILQNTLENAGYQCTVAGSSEDALEELAAQSFDVVFADIRLPGMPGTELLEKIRELHPAVVVVMITALDSSETAVESMRKGAYDYLIKPFNLNHILIAVERALDKKRLETANREYQQYLMQIADERAVETHRLFYSITRVLTHLLDLKIPFNAGHAVRVAEMSRHVARELRMTEDGVRKVHLAALLHDVGMIVVDDTLIHKQDKLTPDERRRIQAAISLAEEILEPILSDEEVRKYLRHHREWMNGEGYPDGLKGKIIPLGARIIGVVEAFDAMTTSRPYRAARTPPEAIGELMRCSRDQFDSRVVSVFAELYEKVFVNLDFSSLDPS
jgi:response regulator RpfG family c-di-GMP phosphodiesterase